MIMKNNLNEELKDIKYLFNYDRGRVISEQQLFEDDQEDFDMSMGDEDLAPSFDSDGNFLGMVTPNLDGMELDEEMDLPVMLPGTKEKERIKVDPGTKPKKPKTPYRPKPGPEPDPKARKRKGDMPSWLTFDELGIDFE
jgi:hypothetical protein